MRQVTQRICRAFEYQQAFKIGNSETDGKVLYLHGNAIARHTPDGIEITNAGWSSNVTKERLNGLSGVNIVQKNFTWYLNGKEWDGGWINVATGEPRKVKVWSRKGRCPSCGVSGGSKHSESCTFDYSDSKKAKTTFSAIGMAAMMGDVFGKTKKEKNDWKTRMLKAGLENSGLIMPDDWDSLSEKQKEKRLNAAIKELV